MKTMQQIDLAIYKVNKSGKQKTTAFSCSFFKNACFPGHSWPPPAEQIRTYSPRTANYGEFLADQETAIFLDTTNALWRRQDCVVLSPDERKDSDKPLIEGFS